jgi:hypothetical protein
MAGQPKKEPSKKSSDPKLTKSDRKRQKIKEAFEKDQMKTFNDIFVIMDETPFGLLIGLQKKQLEAKLANLEKFNFKDIRRISEAFEIDFDKVVAFIVSLVKAQHARPAVKGKSK